MAFFDREQLPPAQPQSNADSGKPSEATRLLVANESFRVGGWWCDVGGWPQPSPQAFAKVFYVMAGFGCVTDADGERHYFGRGDLVILPEGWLGRWDIAEPVHKVWVELNGESVSTAVESSISRASVRRYPDMISKKNLLVHGVRLDAIHGTTPCSGSFTLSEANQPHVESWSCSPGSFSVIDNDCTECLHILEGVFLLTNDSDDNESGATPQLCEAGDTVVFPRGWRGHWDVIETVKVLRVAA